MPNVSFLFYLGIGERSRYLSATITSIDFWFVNNHYENSSSGPLEALLVLEAIYGLLEALGFLQEVFPLLEVSLERLEHRVLVELLPSIAVEEVALQQEVRRTETTHNIERKYSGLMELND